MPKSMTEDVANVIVRALQRGLSRSEIAGVVGVSRRAITRISTNLRLHGAPKAPPSGLKQGRPIKMTEAQAHAMLGWMAGRDYTFYIKDLTQFLKDNHAFAGCDGTVRRALLRAGFKRKLPWHKSEITAWVPPDGPPDLSFVMNANPSPKKSRSTSTSGALANNNATNTQDEDEDEDAALAEEEMMELQERARALVNMSTQPEAQPSQEHNPGIDPALEAATLTPDRAPGGPRPHQMTSQAVPPFPLMGLRSSPPTAAAAAAAALPEHQPPTSLDQQPAYREPQQSPSQPLRVVMQHLQEQPRQKPSPRKRAPARPRAQKPSTAKQPPIDPTILSSLQTENARQKELIAQLQQQLAQGSPVPLPSPASLGDVQSAASAAATATAAMHAHSQHAHEISQQQNGQQQQHHYIEQQSKHGEEQQGDHSLAQTTNEQVRQLHALIDATEQKNGPFSIAPAANATRGYVERPMAYGDDDDDAV